MRNKILIHFFCCFLPLAAYSQESNSFDELQRTKEYLNVFSEAINLHESSPEKALLAAEKVELAKLSLSDSNLKKVIGAKLEFLEDYFGYDHAKKELVELISIYEKEESKMILAFLRHHLLDIHFNNHDFDSALVEAEHLSNHYKEINHNEKLGEILLRKSIILYGKGEYINSIEASFKAIEYFEDSHENKHLAFSYLQVGSTYLFINFLDEAKEYYNLAGEYFLRFGDSLGYSMCESNIALVEYEIGNNGKAISILKKNLPFIEKSKRTINQSFAYQSLSDCYFKAENYDSAKYFIRRSLRLDDSLNYSVGLAKDYAVLAEIAFIKGKNDQALSYSIKATEELASIDDLELEASIRLLLSKIYEQKGDLKLSNDNLKRYIELFDSLDAENDLINKITYQENNKLKETKFQLEIAKQNKKLQEKENSNQLNIIRGLAALLILFILGLIFISNTNRKNKKLNAELLEKKKLIEEELNIKRSLLQEIHHRVKNNLQIISSMLSIQSQYLKNEKLERIIDECRSRISSMSLIHERLYKSETNRNPLFNEYVKELIPRLIETYQVDESQIKLELDIEEIELSLDESLPCGLIINEVVSNCIKHAFPNKKNGTIKISMKSKGPKIVLNIEDDGIGIKDNQEPKKQETFGYLLIYTLAAQLEAKVEVASEKGLSYQFSWKRTD